MPGIAVESRPARLFGLLAGQRNQITEECHGDVRASDPEFTVPDRDHGGRRDERDDQHRGHAEARQKRHGGIEWHEHEADHRSGDGGAEQCPQRWAESLAVIAGQGARTGGGGSRVVHYPRGVIDSVDVPIIASHIPAYAHPGDAGADLVAAEAVRLEPGQRALVGTGVRLALPDGYVAFVVPRSGLAAKHGITIVNAPGTVDSGYRGEIKVSLLNTDSSEAYDVAVGDRIAQVIIMPVPRTRFVPVDELPDSTRGDAGFGSTGYQTGATS